MSITTCHVHIGAPCNARSGSERPHGRQRRRTVARSKADDSATATTRRSLLQLVAAASLPVALPLSLASPSFADVAINPSDFDFPVIELPKDFVTLAYDLIDALRESIETDLSGAPEREVRRKAEPAKDLVKRFINTWGGASAIAETTACSEIRLAVQELGEFYKTQGQRAGLTSDVASSILAHLDQAEKALGGPREKEEKGFLGSLGL